MDRVVDRCHFLPCLGRFRDFAIGQARDPYRECPRAMLPSHRLDFRSHGPSHLGAARLRLDASTALPDPATALRVAPLHYSSLAVIGDYSRVDRATLVADWQGLGSLGHHRLGFANCERRHPRGPVVRAMYRTVRPRHRLVPVRPIGLRPPACFPSFVAILPRLVGLRPCGLVPSALGCDPSSFANPIGSSASDLAGNFAPYLGFAISDRVPLVVAIDGYSFHSLAAALASAFRSLAAMPRFSSPVTADLGPCACDRGRRSHRPLRWTGPNPTRLGQFLCAFHPLNHCLETVQSAAGYSEAANNPCRTERPLADHR